MIAGKKKIKSNWQKKYLSFKRRQISPVIQDLKWPLLGLAWIVAISMAYFGLNRHFAIEGLSRTAFDHIYRIMQLIVLESGDIEGYIPWQLEVSRFLLPILAGYTAIQAFITIFRYHWQLIRIKFFKKHLVICGLGEKGFRIAGEFLAHGYQVIVIERESENLLIEQIRRQGAVVLVGDATDPSLLSKARVHFAKFLINVCRDDGINAEIAFKACDLVRPFQNRVLTAYIHIFTLDLYNLLSAWSLGAVSEIVSFRLELFNVPARGARLMLRQYNPFPSNQDNSCGSVPKRLLIIGLGKMGSSLTIQAAHNWWVQNGNNGRRLNLTLIDREATDRIELLSLQYPSLNKVCSIEALSMDTNDPEFERGKYLLDDQGRCDIEMIFICLDNEVEALVSALKLHRKTEGTGAQIVVRMKSKDGLASMINEDYGKNNFDRIKTFYLLEEICSYEAVLGGTHEILARAIHARYLAHQSKLKSSMPNNPSRFEWEDLPEEFRESNRHQASQIEEKLKLVGYTIQPLTSWDIAKTMFTDAEIEKMAALEHKRWCEERHAQGWKFCSGDKNIKRKTSPYLVSWDQLPEAMKELNRDAVKEIPEMLTLAGLQICRIYDAHGTENRNPK